MKYICLFILAFFLSCKGENQCKNFAKLQWCIEPSAEFVQINPSLLQVEDKKDGLFFAADIAFQQLNLDQLTAKRNEIESNKNQFDLETYTKQDVYFYSFSQVAEASKKLSNTEIINGEIIGIHRDGAYTITYRGVNKKKTKRFIDLLMQ